MFDLLDDVGDGAITQAGLREKPAEFGLGGKGKIVLEKDQNEE